MHHRNEHDSYSYLSMSRRESLKWLRLLAAGSAVGLTAGCTKALEDDVPVSAKEHWPDLDIKPVTAKGYRQGGHFGYASRITLAADINSRRTYLSCPVS